MNSHAKKCNLKREYLDTNNYKSKVFSWWIVRGEFRCFNFLTWLVKIWKYSKNHWIADFIFFFVFFHIMPLYKAHIKTFYLFASTTKSVKSFFSLIFGQTDRHVIAKL